jgi:hypothetical protein
MQSSCHTPHANMVVETRHRRTLVLGLGLGTRCTVYTAIPGSAAEMAMAAASAEDDTGKDIKMHFRGAVAVASTSDEHLLKSSGRLYCHSGGQ